ncbi:MAG: hypothetical protein KY475_20200 [Planctomycetes bacterium]|nr:hypothetical protein [Planctomycetota bacterium]
MNAQLLTRRCVRKRRGAPGWRRAALESLERRLVLDSAAAFAAADVVAESDLAGAGSQISAGDDGAAVAADASVDGASAVDQAVDVVDQIPVETLLSAVPDASVGGDGSINVTGGADVGGAAGDVDVSVTIGGGLGAELPTAAVGDLVSGVLDTVRDAAGALGDVSVTANVDEEGASADVSAAGAGVTVGADLPVEEILENAGVADLVSRLDALADSLDDLDPSHHVDRAIQFVDRAADQLGRVVDQTVNRLERFADNNVGRVDHAAEQAVDRLMRFVDRADGRLDRLLDRVDVGNQLDDLDSAAPTVGADVEGAADAAGDATLGEFGELAFDSASDLDAAIDEFAGDVAAANESRLMSSVAA